MFSSHVRSTSGCFLLAILHVTPIVVYITHTLRCKLQSKACRNRIEAYKDGGPKVMGQAGPEGGQVQVGGPDPQLLEQQGCRLGAGRALGHRLHGLQHQPGHLRGVLGVMLQQSVALQSLDPRRPGACQPVSLLQSGPTL